MESVDPRSYFKEMNKFNSDGLSEQSMNSVDSLYKNRPMTRGFLSEYQHSYFTLPKERIRYCSARPKDSVSFVNKSMIQESFMLENISKKNSNDKNQNLTNSWYKDDYKYYGNENLYKSHDENLNMADKSVDPYKRDYIKNFEEMNSGLVDNYSLTKGGSVLQLKNGSRNTNRSKFHFSSQSNLPMIPRNHDLRSVWIPKKFEGRNMFVSHIDSMIFPDKSEKDIDASFKKNYDAESKKTFEKPSYDRIEKSVKYVMNYENKYVPSVRWYPPQKEFAAPHQHVKDDTFDSKSIYQADFEPPIPTETEKSLKPYSGDEIQRQLEKLNGRRTEIDSILAKS